MKCGNGYIEYKLLVNSNETAESNDYNILTVDNGETSGWAVSLPSITQKNHSFETLFMRVIKEKMWREFLQSL